jgi:pyridoxine 5-phosphate synthase
MLRLGVNIDHVATVRNARGGNTPCPVRASIQAIESGADSITAHLREDRRHIRDSDIARIKNSISKPLNFEMAATQEMLAIALATRPHAACLVPEKREERTTEGGLNVLGNMAYLAPYIAKLAAAHIRVSLFVEPDCATLDACLALKSPVVELHTGSWCHAIEAGDTQKASAEFEKLHKAADYGLNLGLEVHAGHGLNFVTAEQLASVKSFVEFNIGHFLIGEAIFIGLPQAIQAMRAAMDKGREA